MRKLMIMLVIASSICGSALAQKDGTLQSIDAVGLVRAIQASTLKSPQQEVLLDRAAASGLSQIAYEQYTRFWQKSPYDAYANLRRGEAAEDYWEYATRPSNHQISLVSPLAQELFQSARDCLTEAQKKAPADASANLAYGRFLFWYGSQMPKGLNYIKKAIAISPKSYAAHEILGDAYAEHSGDVYNLPLAEKELKIASMLRPTAAYPHWRLIRVYLDEDRLQDAKRELQAYVNLTPPSETQTDVINFYRRQFDHAAK